MKILNSGLGLKFPVTSFYRYGLWMTLDFYVQAPMAIDFLMIKRMKCLLPASILFYTEINWVIFI